MQDSHVIVALIPNFCEPGCTVGLGYVDLAKQVLGMAEFLDDSHFTNVESALVSLGCKECILPLHDVMSKCGVMVTERKKAEFKRRDVAQDLGRIVKSSISRFD
ncbi:MUTS-like protein [Artemisia annua]|uniref:MUTS-like protein n=1 Tax=Artemisia annua TaxID=35608 RepID=A0A2U1P8Y8_ARTAN|nr:MUTS-like protein [Artemisia annua]